MHPIVHAEIRSSDPDATRASFADLRGCTCPNEAAYHGTLTFRSPTAMAMWPPPGN